MAPTHCGHKFLGFWVVCEWEDGAKRFSWNPPGGPGECFGLGLWDEEHQRKASVLGYWTDWIQDSEILPDVRVARFNFPWL